MGFRYEKLFTEMLKDVNPMQTHLGDPQVPASEKPQRSVITVSHLSHTSSKSAGSDRSLMDLCRYATACLTDRRLISEP